MGRDGAFWLIEFRNLDIEIVQGTALSNWNSWFGETDGKRGRVSRTALLLFFDSYRMELQQRNGFKQRTPVRSTSWVFRVTRVIPRTFAVAAKSPSMTGKGSGALSRPHSSAAA